MHFQGQFTTGFHRVIAVSSQLLLPLMLLLGGRTCAEEVNSRTYQHHDSVTGLVLTCNLCPPGTYRHAHCTADQQTICAPCPPEHFTKYWNYVSKCLYCTSCGDDEIVKAECCPQENRICECKEGYYSRFSFCMKHRECPARYGVKRKGTALSNTECEKCPRGSYSNSSGQGTCVRHTDCASHGLQVVLRGSGWHDNLCASCEDLRTRGSLELLRGILPDFFAHEKVKLPKLHRFVKKLLRLGGREQLSEAESWDSLQGHISKWVRDTGAEGLKKLPEILRSCKVHNTADKLERKLRRMENVRTCQNENELVS